jgi:hypothetical protein
MPSKKVLKVNESEISTSNTEVTKPTKSKKVKSKDVEEPKPINELLKTELKNIDEQPKTKSVKKNVKTKSTDEPIKTETKTTDEPIKTETKTTDEPIKTETKTTDKPIKTEKLKKKVKETVEQETVKTKKETKSKENDDNDESQLIIRKELEEIKSLWASKQNKLEEIEIERSKIEADIQIDIKRLKELLDKVESENKSNQNEFLIDNKIQLNNTKNNIIPVDSDSSNESDDDDTSESDSESDKKLTLLKGKKPKQLIKTTKGSVKNLKLNVNDSDTESD